MKRLAFLCMLFSGFCFGNSMDPSAADSSQNPSQSTDNDTSLSNPVTLQRGMSFGDFTPVYGFRGYAFGTPHMRINGLKMRSIHNRDTWYEVQGGIDIGRARMKSMGFGFRDDRFYGVIALPADYQSYLDLKSIIDSVYGPPMKTDSLQGSITYLWNVPNVVFKLRFYWGSRSLEDKTNDRILSMIATPILTDKPVDPSANPNVNPSVNPSANPGADPNAANKNSVMPPYPTP